MPPQLQHGLYHVHVYHHLSSPARIQVPCSFIQSPVASLVCARHTVCKAPNPVRPVRDTIVSLSLPLFLLVCSALRPPPSPRQAVRSAREMDRLTRLQPGRSDPNIVRVQQAVIIAFASALVGGVVVSTSTMELDCKGGRGGGFSFGKSKPSRFFALWLMMMTR